VAPDRGVVIEPVAANPGAAVGRAVAVAVSVGTGGVPPAAPRVVAAASAPLVEAVGVTRPAETKPLASSAEPSTTATAVRPRAAACGAPCWRMGAHRRRERGVRATGATGSISGGAGMAGR